MRRSPLLPVLLLSLLTGSLLTGAAASAATVPDPTELRGVVPSPCGTPLPVDRTCIQASIVAPQPGTVVEVSLTGTPTPIRVVGERDQLVFTYLLRGERAPYTLVNTVPYRTRADESGVAEVALNFYSAAPGRYLVMSFYLATLSDRVNEQSFLHLTGTPVLELMVPGTNTPEPPSSSEPPTYCSFEGHQRVTSPWGTIVKAQNQVLYVETDAETVPDIAGLRTSIRAQLVDELPTYVCRQIAEFPTTYSETDADIRTILLHQSVPAIYADGVVQKVLPGGCAGLPSISTPVLDIQHGPLGSVFHNNGGSIDNVFESVSCGRRYTYISGSSPLLFLTSPTLVDASVQVDSLEGQITFADPPATDGRWRATVHSAAVPLYYEFLAPLPPLPATGWTVEGDHVEAFVRELLGTWGYNPSEVTAFVDRDIRPRLPEAPHFTLRLFDRAAVDAILPLRISPAPIHTERLLFHLTPTAAPASMLPPAPVPHVSASGFTAREFGAVIAQ